MGFLKGAEFVGVVEVVEVVETNSGESIPVRNMIEYSRQICYSKMYSISSESVNNRKNISLLKAKVAIS